MHGDAATRTELLYSFAVTGPDAFIEHGACRMSGHQLLEQGDKAFDLGPLGHQDEARIGAELADPQGDRTIKTLRDFSGPFPKRARKQKNRIRAAQFTEKGNG